MAAPPTGSVLALEQAAAGFAALDVFHLADTTLVIDVLGERGYRAAQLEGGIRGGLTYLAAHAMGLRACGLTFYDHETIRFFFPDPLPQRWRDLTERSSAAVSETPHLQSTAAVAPSLEGPEADALKTSSFDNASPSSAGPDIASRSLGAAIHDSSIAGAPTTPATAGHRARHAAAPTKSTSQPPTEAGTSALNKASSSCAFGDLEWDLGVMFLTAVGERRRKP